MKSHSSEDQEPDRAAQRRLESDLLILQADQKRFEREHDEFLAEIKRLKNDAKRLEIVIKEKELEEQKINREKLMNEAEIAHLKKQMSAF